MRTVRTGARVPARWLAFACGFFLLATCMLAASASAWVPHLSPLFSAPLTRDPGAELPAPTRYSYRATHTTKMLGVEAPLRTRLETTVPAEIGDVLAFYRTELGKLGWQEQRDGAVISADHIRLAFVSPLGPAMLELGHRDRSTSVTLVRRNQDAAASAHVLPKPGLAALLLANLGDEQAEVSIDSRIITLPARAGKVRPEAPLLDLVPGKYPYVVKVEGRPARYTTIELLAGDAWDVTVGPDGNPWSPIQLY